jgi:hypothetical protein
VDSCFRKAFRITTCQSMKPTALLNHSPQSLTKKPQMRQTQQAGFEHTPNPSTKAY